MVVIELFQMTCLCATDDERTSANSCILRTDPPAYIAETVAIIAARILANECVLPKDVAPFIEFGDDIPGDRRTCCEAQVKFYDALLFHYLLGLFLSISSNSFMQRTTSLLCATLF
jgi:hypothetical protein